MAMAPKTAPKPLAKSAVYLKTSRIHLSDLSTGSESGWRRLNEKRVVELKNIILKGDFGNTLLAKPSVLCDPDGKAQSMCLFVE